MSTRALARRFLALLLPALLLASACGEEAPTVLAPDPQLARGGGGGGGGGAGDPVVESVDPNEGEQGQTLEIVVAGSGFLEGDEVALGIDGVPSDAITTNATVFEGPGALRANITIAGTATVASYDVMVFGGRGRKGIGTALFAVKLGPHANAVATDLGAIEGRSVAFDINDRGEAVGHDVGHALYWGADRQIVDLGPGWARAINNQGQIAGHFTNAGGDRRGFVTTAAGPSSRVEMSPLAGHDLTEAYGISDAGEVVGVSGSSATPTGVVWAAPSGAVLRELDGLPGGPGTSRPYAINASGHVVGVSSSGTGGTRAVIWLDQSGSPIDLTAGADWAYAYGVSAESNGQVFVAGQRGHSGDYWATRWTVRLDGSFDFVDLAPSSYGWDVNTLGDVVGDIGPSKRGYLWRWSGGEPEALELGALVGRGSSSAQALNEAGLVVGWSQVSTKGKDKGLEHAVLWWLP